MAFRVMRTFGRWGYLLTRRHQPRVQMLQVSTDPLSMPPPDGTDVYPEKLHNIVQDIAGLTLRETAQLNELIKKTLNIPDVPIMTAGSFAPPETSAPDAQETSKDEQTEFTVKLVKFSESAKVKLIKEVKLLMSEMNLVQAKKFVESVPQVLKEGVSKDEAEKLKLAIESAGGEVEIE